MAWTDTASNESGFIEERRYMSETAFGSGTVAETTRYAYDDLGQLSAVGEFAELPSSSNAPTRLEIMTYDPISGQVASVESPEGTIHYEYADATGLHTRTYTDNNDTSYDYDLQGRLWHVTVTKLNGTTLSPPQVTTYGYDPGGNLTTVTYEASGVVSTYDYDALNRLDHLTVTNDSQYKLFEQEFTLSADGKRESVVEKRYDGSSTTPFSKVRITWTYDADDRLVAETRDQDTTPGSGGDNFGTRDSGDYTDAFAYDLGSNRIRLQHGWDADGDGQLGTGDTVDSTTAYLPSTRYRWVFVRTNSAFPATAGEPMQPSSSLFSASTLNSRPT